MSFTMKRINKKCRSGIIGCGLKAQEDRSLLSIGINHQISQEETEG